MKTLSLALFAAAILLINTEADGQPSIGGYNVYYGHLHNHCNISDGQQTPDYAYSYAKTIGDLDFFSLADHSGSIDPLAGEWAAMKSAANKYNEEGVFTAFWGFEWTENVQGHVAVINSENYITTAAPYNSFAGLCSWLNSNECVAFFNHPGRNNSTGLEFSHFSTTPTDKIVGMELWNKTDRFNVYYYTDGYYSGDGNLGWYDEALSRGWKIGASGSEDNHSVTWGTMTESKLAVLASANNRVEIMNALKARRFFSTYDKNLALSFTIGGAEMGSSLTSGSYGLQILASDGTGEIFTQVQLLRKGIVINTWAPNSASPVITSNLNCFNGEYYYVRVLQADGDEAISSPISITVDNPGDPIIRTSVIATGMDDVEEGATGGLYANSTDIELVYDGTTYGNQIVGLRFINLAIPRNAAISNAYIQFTCDEVNTAACNLTIRGEAADNSAVFASVSRNVSARLKTNSSVSWIPPGWGTVNESGVNQRTPNLSALIQEIVSRPGYTAASAITMIITGTGKRVAEAYEGVPASAARMLIEYSTAPANQPPVVSITSPASGSAFTEPATISIMASATDADGYISKVEFYDGTKLLGEDATDPYTWTMPDVQVGTLNLAAKATDNTGASTTSAIVSISITAAPIQSYTFSQRISARTNDAEEYSKGTMTLSSTALELVYSTNSTGNQLIGLRFTNVPIPRGANITMASLQFGASKRTTASCTLTIRGEYTSSAAAFTSVSKNISSRTTTGSYVTWAPSGWTTAGAVGAAQKTPDLKTIVQEITGNSLWSQGNNMAFIIRGTGTRTAYAYEGSTSKAALLYIEYNYSGGKSGMIASGGETDGLPEKFSEPENRLICYPVPFNDLILIQLAGDQDESIQSVRMINCNGVIVKDIIPRSGQVSIDAADLPTGIYVIQLKTNLSVYRKTIVKI